MKNSKALFIILLLALCLRVIYLFFYNSLPEWNILTVDNYYHLNWAIDFANGNILGDTTYFRAPFYIYCLGFLYAILGATLWISRLFGLAIGIFSVLLTYLIGKKTFDHKTGLLAAFIHTIYPITLYFESELLLDPLFMLLLQLILYRVLKWLETKSIRNVFMTGILLGFAAITRPTILIWVVPLLLLIFTYRGQINQWYKQILFFVLALFIVITPITIRNLIIADDPVLISSQGGINFYIGNNPDADGVSAIMPEPMGHNWQISQIRHIAETESGEKLSSGEISSFWFRKSIEWIKDNPSEFISLYLKKLYFNISNREISNNRDLNQFFNNIPLLKYNPVVFGILFAFSVVPILLLWRKNKVLKLFVILLLTYILAGSLFFFNSRFRLPLMPFYFIFSASGIILIIKFMRESIPKTVLAYIIVLMALIFSYYPVVSFSKGISPQTLISKGNYYYTQSNFKTSLKFNREAQKVNPKFPEVNLNIGNCFLKSGHIDSAQFYFQKEIQNHPLRSKAYTNSGTLKYLEYNYQESLELARISIKHNPYDITAHQVLLRALFAIDSLDKKTYYQTALESSRKLADDIYLLNEAAVLLSNRGMYMESEEFLDKALLSTPPPIETDDEAFKHYFRNSRENIQRQKAFSYFQLGYIKGLQDSYGESIQYSQRAIILDSSLVDAYANLISGYIATNQSDKADSVINHALKLFPSYSPLLRLKEILSSQ